MNWKKAKIIFLLSASGLLGGFFSNNAQAAHYYHLRLTHNAFVYNQKGKRIRRRRVLKKKSYVWVERSKKIGKTKFLQMHKKTFIKAANVKIPRRTHRRVVYRLKPAVAKQIQQTMKQLHFKGNLTVYRHQKKVYALTTANKADSAYLINSCQKFLTAALVMRAANQGKLKLTDCLDKYYPQIPGSDQITLKDLLDMKAGLNLKANSHLGPVPFINDEQTLTATIPNMLFDPDLLGSQKYASMNFAILSNVLAKVCHASYQRLFTAIYIKKLGLKHTAFVWASPRRLKQIRFVKNPMNLDEIHGQLGAGSVAMSNNDLYFTANRLLAGKILNKKTIAELYGLNQYRDPAHTYHGGFYVNKDFIYNNGAGYHYYNFLRITKNGQNGMVAQTNHSQNFGQDRRVTMKLFSLINKPNSYRKITKTWKKSIF